MLNIPLQHRPPWFKHKGEKEILGRVDPTLIQRSLKRELEAQNELELPKELFENKTEYFKVFVLMNYITKW